MAKKKLIRMYCKRCKKITIHEIINTEGQKSCVCLACQREAIEMENARIACLNQKENLRNEADRIMMEEKVRNLSSRYGIGV